MKINREWHERHPMPKNATEEQRARWHIDHAQHCSCRKPTPAIAKLMEEYLRRKR